MKRFILLVMTLLLLPTISNAASSQDHYIPEAHVVINLSADWICITKNTDLADVDLSGTLFNYDGVKSSIAQTIDMLNSQEYESVKLVAMGFDPDHGLIEAQIGSAESDETKEVWDISLIPNVEEMFMKSRDAFEIYETNHTKWIGVKNTDSGHSILAYTTVSNGRSVSISVTAYHAQSETERAEIAHGLLNKIQFTKKDPKPAIQVEHHDGENKQDGISTWAKKMWRIIERYIALEISGWVVIGGLTLVIGAIGFIVSLFTKRK